MNIEIVGKFYNNHSLSIINRNLAIGLSKKTQVTVTAIDSASVESTVDKTEVRQLKELEKTELTPDIQIRHSYPPVWRWPDDSITKIIFIQPWEFSKIPLEWQGKFETFADHVVTPSNWTKEVFLNAGLRPDKISVVPNGYNPLVFNRDGRISTDNKFTFLFVGCGQYRKGLDILLDAYRQAFKKADHVRLVIKDTPKIYGENNLIPETLRLQYLSDMGEVTVIDDDYTQTEMADLYRSSDVIVHPYRGEGFGMHIQEAMACGVLPLVTDGGATDDFITDNFGLKIKSKLALVDLTNPKVFAIKPGDCLTNMGQHSWILEPDLKDLISKLQYIYYHQEKQRVLSKVDNVNTLTTWEKSVDCLWEVIKQVYNNGSSMPARYG